MSEPREHWGGVLGLAVGLTLLVGLVVVVARHPARAEDARALLAEWFVVGDLPPGLEVAEAATLADGRRMVRLVESAAPAESPLPPAKPGDKPVDWSKLAVGPAGSEPREVLIVRYPRGSGASELGRLFTSTAQGLGPPNGMGGMGGGGMGGGGGGARSVVLERDQLVWGELAARYVVERTLEGEATFRDGLRVNLSHDETAMVLFASWSRGLPASRERVEQLLHALQPRTP